MPAEYEVWNARWGAPSGHPKFVRRVLGRHAPGPLRPKLTGPFAFQLNNTTRLFEYPWAYYATPLSRGMRAVDLGGSLSGFQFVLARAGLRVVNVDPGEDASIGWPVDEASISRLNRAFKTDVELRRSFIQDAGLEDETFDRFYSISTLEHIPVDSLPTVMKHVKRILVPGGLCVLTVDLFLDLAPFTSKKVNEWGENVDIRWLVEASKMTLVAGDTSELFGFDDFNPKAIQENLSQYLYGASYPALAQTLVLAKD